MKDLVSALSLVYITLSLVYIIWLWHNPFEMLSGLGWKWMGY